MVILTQDHGLTYIQKVDDSVADYAAKAHSLAAKQFN